MRASGSLRHAPRRHGVRIVLTWAVALGALSVWTQAPATGTGPHWRPDGCGECHESATPTAAQPALKTTPASALCATCHDGGEAAECAHRSDITVAGDRESSIAEPLRPALAGGRVVCTTCHDMKPHCALDVRQRYRNKSFLRGGPFEARGEQCFLCHQKSAYRKPSPHMQARKDGIKEGTCTFCHGSLPQRDATGQWQPVQYATNGSQWSDMCTGCHGVGPHPSGSVHGKTGWIHMVEPTGAYAERMRARLAAEGGRMPLDPQTGTITCVTCHDPHDERVPGFAVASAPGTKARLRYENMCGACHDK